jgi:hypothetical protein
LITVPNAIEDFPYERLYLNDGTLFRQNYSHAGATNALAKVIDTDTEKITSVPKTQSNAILEISPINLDPSSNGSNDKGSAEQRVPSEKHSMLKDYRLYLISFGLADLLTTLAFIALKSGVDKGSRKLPSRYPTRVGVFYWNC